MRPPTFSTDMRETAWLTFADLLVGIVLKAHRTLRLLKTLGLVLIARSQPTRVHTRNLSSIIFSVLEDGDVIEVPREVWRKRPNPPEKFIVTSPNVGHWTTVVQRLDA